MHDENFARRLVACLDEPPVPYRVQHRLAAARQLALMAQGSAQQSGRRTLAMHLRQGAILLATALMLAAGYTYWQAERYIEQLIETDMAILTGEPELEFYREGDVSGYLRDLSTQGEHAALDK